MILLRFRRRRGAAMLVNAVIVAIMMGVMVSSFAQLSAARMTVAGDYRSVVQARQLAEIKAAELGLINYDSGEGDEVFLGKEIGQQRPYGENTQTVIDQEVKKIVNKCYKDAKAMIEEHIDVLHKCAALLLEKERINRAEFEALFEPETEVETQA